MIIILAFLFIFIVLPAIISFVIKVSNDIEMERRNAEQKEAERKREIELEEIRRRYEQEKREKAEKERLKRKQELKDIEAKEKAYVEYASTKKLLLMNPNFHDNMDEEGAISEYYRILDIDVPQDFLNYVDSFDIIRKKFGYKFYRSKVLDLYRQIICNDETVKIEWRPPSIIDSDAVLLSAMKYAMDSIITKAGENLKLEYANMYAKVINDMTAAVFWYESAASNGNADTMFNLGLCYYDYRGVDERDYDKAFQLFSDSARQGLSVAFRYLGLCYENGNGTKKNFQRAGDCYKKAIELGTDCKKELDSLYTQHKWDKNKYNPDSLFSESNVFVLSEDFWGFVDKNYRQLLEDYVKGKPEDGIIKANNISEQLCNTMIQWSSPNDHTLNLAEKIERLKNIGMIDRNIADGMHYIRKVRNRIMHNGTGEPISEEEADCARKEIDSILAFAREINA